jgi:AAA family ATP:ADP antiporter
LKQLCGAVVGCGGLIMLIMAWMQKNVLTDPDCVPAVKRDAKKKKTKMSMGESTKFLASSPYIKDLAFMVIGYGMAINIVEVIYNFQY